MIPGPTGNRHANIVPYNVYKTRTVPLFIAVANDRMFSKLCNHLNLQELPNDPLFSTNRARVENRDLLEAKLNKAFESVDGEVFGPTLLDNGIPAAPILNIETVANSAHARHRNMVIQTQEYTGPGIPIKLSDTPASIRHFPPRLGEKE